MAEPQQRRYTYAQLVDAWQAEYPGEFDGFDRADIADAILAELPELSTVVDPSTRGTEVVPPPNLGGHERGPGRRVPGPVPPPDTNPIRPGTYTDMGIEAGLVAVPSVMGGVLGSGAGPVGSAVGLAAGGSFGEMLREGYQLWSRTRNDGFSLPNIAVQGAINAVPIARMAGAAGRFAAPELAKRIAGPAVRIAGSALEGATASVTSTAAERIIRDTELPSLEELGVSAAFGAPFGAAVGGGAEIIHARQANAAVPTASTVDAMFSDLADPGKRNVAAQAIYDLATLVGEKGNPAEGAAILQRLVSEANTYAQQDLRLFAGEFVRDFSARADTLTMDGQAAEIEGFLQGLKERGAVEQTIGDVQKILTDIRTLSTPRAFDQPSEFSRENVREIGPWHEVPADPGQTSAERAFGGAFEQALGSPAAARSAPPMSDPSGPPSFARHVEPRQRDLPVREGVPPMQPGEPLGTPPALAPRGVDVLPGVQKGAVSRDEAVFMQLLSQDLRDFGFERGTAQRVTDTELRPDDPLLEDQNVIFTPHSAGTPILRMFEELGIKLTRGQIATQIENLLEGRARRPGKAALAARNIARAMQEAWDPAAGRWDWSRVQDGTLKAAGFPLRRSFKSPYTPLGNVLERQGEDIRSKYGYREQPTLEGPAGPRAEDLAPDEVAEARKLVRSASDDDLLRLYSEMTGYNARVEDMEAPEDFAGDWYDVGPGILAAELERRGLAKYGQAGLEMEGPGTPGRSLVAPELQGPDAPGGPKTLAEATARVERMRAEGNLGPEYLEALQAEERLAEGGTSTTVPEQPALLPEVRAEERPTPALMSEAELFRLTPETPKPASAGRVPKAPSLFGPEEGIAGDVRGVRAAKARAVRELTISDSDFRDLQETVESAGDEEAAGLLLGDPDGTVRRVVLSDNRAADPTKQFEIGADVVDRALHFAASRSWQVLGSFHSQPTGSAEPSKLDLKGSVADLPLVILGVRGGSLRDVKVWQPTPRGQGRTAAPWLEGALTRAADAQLTGGPAPSAPEPVVRWAVERIPKFTGAPGDTPALDVYLKTHKAEFSTEPWFVRSQQFLEEGNARQAWVEVQAAGLQAQKGVRDLVQGSPLKDETREALLARVDRAMQAGPQDPVGALFALYDGRTTWVEGVGRVVVAPEVPPALRGKNVSAGPGGILQPGAAHIPLPDEQTVVGMTVEALNDVLRDTNAHSILDDPTQNSFTRLNRQVAEQLMLRAPSSWGALKSWRTAMKQRGMSDRELNQQIAAHLTKTASESGRFLAALSVWKQRHQGEIRAIESIRGASGEIDDVMIIGAGGRRIGRLGDLVPADTFKDVVAPTRAWDRAMLLNDLTRSERGAFDLFEASSRAFMLSQWATAARNFWSVNARWGIEMFDELASAVASTTLLRPGRALNHVRRAADMLRYTPILRPDGWVMPWHARQAQWEQVFDSTTFLASLPAGRERRAALALLENIPEEQAHFLGSTAFGEPTPHGTSKYRILNWISQPRVQNTLTMFNRAQEFTARSGMYVANLRDALRQRGVDPNLLYQLPPADLAAKLGGPDEMRRVLHHSIAGALDFTFSGALIKKGFGKDEFGRPKVAHNAWLIEKINQVSGIRAGYPWPRFNLSAAPRFIWDHSGVNAVVESMNQVLLEHAGLGTVRTRFALGKKAAALETKLIPELETKFRDAQADMGEQLQKVQALSREQSIRKRMIARLERRGLGAAADAEWPHLEQLTNVLEREMEAFSRAEDRMKGLTSQINAEQAIVDQAKAVSAPETYAELWGRAGAGVSAMLVPAMLLRAEQEGKGTKWYELRYDIPGIGDKVIDTRPLAPFTQFLFFGDVLNDLQANTDWAGVWEDTEAGTNFLDAMYGRYEGKYTSKTLGQQMLNAFLSMSQAAGTTLAVLEQFTSIGDQGFPGLERLGHTTMEAIGSFLARFTIPFAQFKGLTDLVDPSESHARIAGPEAGMAAPLAQPLGNLPFIGAMVIPETYNQLTGQPLDAFMPELRASLGITLRQWNRVSGEINATGVPGSSVYIRATRDPFLDRLIGFHYSQAVSQFADPLIFANEYYLGLDSPATRRDYLQSSVFPMLKKYAIGQAMIDVGWQRLAEERETPEQRRRRLRTERLQGLAREEGVTFEEGGASDASESEPGADDPAEVLPGDAPAAGPAGEPPRASLRGPEFGEDRRPAFDRAFSPAPEFETA